MNPNRRNGELFLNEFVDASSPALPVLGLIEFFISIWDTASTIAFAYSWLREKVKCFV
jgi:hypothetical protein